MKLIPLTRGLFAKVDDEDFERISKHKWYAQSQKQSHTFYACRCEMIDWKIRKKKYYYMHREILGINDNKVHVDHINHDGIDNRKENMRKCNRFENQRNRTASFDGSSKYKGVFYRKDRGKWCAQIKINGKKTHLGHFLTEIDAAIAYDNMAKIHHKEFANINIK